MEPSFSLNAPLLLTFRGERFPGHSWPLWMLGVSPVGAAWSHSLDISAPGVTWHAPFPVLVFFSTSDS